MPKEDLRVVKTKQNIKNTFLELLSKNSINNITVQNILEDALINRSTFYKYYHDKYDLAEQLSKSCLSDFADFIEGRFSYSHGIDGLENVIEQLYSYIYNNQILIVGLWTIETEEIHLYKDMELLLKENCFLYLTKMSNIQDETSKDYLSSLYASIVLTTIRWILSQSNKVDVGNLLLDTAEFIRTSMLK